MLKLATAGSKEARQLEQLKNKFEKIFQAKSNSKAESDGKVSKKNDNLRYLLSAIEKATPSVQELERNIQTVANMDSVYTVDPSKLEDSGSDIKEIYEQYFDQWGQNIYSDVLGDISVKRSSMKSEFAHGNTAQKIASIEAIPAVIQDGKIVDWFEKHRGLYRVTVAAPIKIGNEPYFMGVMLQRDNKHQRLYIHDVLIEKEASNSSEEHLSTTGAAKENRNLFLTNILQKIKDVKQKFSLSSDSTAQRPYGDYRVSGEDVMLDRDLEAELQAADVDETLAFVEHLLKALDTKIRQEDAEEPAQDLPAMERSAPADPTQTFVEELYKARGDTESVGAAPSGFDPISHLQYEYGNLPDGEKAVRDDSMPKSTTGKDKVSLTARTVKGAKVTPDDFVDLLDQQTAGGALSYLPVTNNAITQIRYTSIPLPIWR